MSDLLDTVFEEVLVDIVQSASVTFKGNNYYDGTINEFTNLPKATTYILPDSDEDFAQKKYVDDSIASLVASAPSTLDTLNKLSQALGSDPSFSVTVTNFISTKAPIDSPTFTGTVSGITKAMVGLSNVDNTSDSLKPVSTATQTALDLKANINDPTFTGTVSGITKSMVGLSDVDNTSDSNKPISSATQDALDLKADITYVDSSIAQIGSSSGISQATQDALDLKADITYVDNSIAQIGSSSGISQATQGALDLKASITYVDNSISNLVGQSPALMDTIFEIQQALNSDPNFSTTIMNQLGLKANTSALSSYQPLLSGSSDLSIGTLACTSLTPTGLITSTRFTEVLTSVSHSSNVYNLNFNSSNCFFSANNTTGNFTVNLQNIPTSSSNRQFTFSLITNTPTHICATVSARDTASTFIVNAVAPRYVGGSAPIVSTNQIAVHSFTLIQCFTTKFIIYNVASF